MSVSETGTLRESISAKMRRKGAGLASNSAAEISEGLSIALAETAVAQMKARNFHGHMKGMAFGLLHDLIGKIFTDHHAAADDLAKRVKALGGHAEGRYARYLKVSSIAESNGCLPAEEMIAALRDDQKALSMTFRSLAETSDKHVNVIANTMAIARAETHGKFA